MTAAVTHLTQSKFYSPAFNGAIFDGAIRIYFAQHQEADALKIYFRIQKLIQEEEWESLMSVRKGNSHIFIMLYPSDETFLRSFEGQLECDRVIREDLGEDWVIGIRGPLSDSDEPSIVLMVDDIINEWRNQPARVTARSPLDEVTP